MNGVRTPSRSALVGALVWVGVVAVVAALVWVVITRAGSGVASDDGWATRAACGRARHEQHPHTHTPPSRPPG